MGRGGCEMSGCAVQLEMERGGENLQEMAPQVVKLLQRYEKDVFSCGLSEILNFSVEFSLGLMICQGQKHRGKGIDGLI